MMSINCYNNYFLHLIAKPIDLLAKYISAEDNDLAIEMQEPYTYLYVSPLYNYLICNI